MASKKPNEIEVSDDECTITFNDFTIKLHPTVYQYFTSEDIKKGDRAEILEKALNVGLLAAQQGRVAKAVELFNSEISGEYHLLSTHMEVLQHKLEKDNKFKTDLKMMWLLH